MASGAAAAAAEGNFKTLVLKVSIHCEGCKRKVSKILSKIEGVESVDIDTRQNKVSIKSLVDAQTVIQKLKKHGKPAELLQEVNPSDVRVLKPATETDKPPEPAKIGVQGGSPSSPGADQAETVMAVDNSVTEAKETKEEPPENPEKSEEVKPKIGDKNIEDTLKLSREEEKSKKVEELNDEHHTPRQVFPPQPAYVMSYDTAKPSMSQSHFVPPMATVSSQGNIYDDQYRNFPRYYDGPVEAHSNPTSYMHQQTNDPYNAMFSDENPDANCSLM
ncbi:heavy metal-associated isoprenylated plant protein 35-like [Zingiber officinale]|uniref:HMA domain-containing protein n=1 Tax=Zingiber officinale TaxID=94328 RepID=A0A8J5FV18_ZINOF|nr:heavy metal-associated isoprenylated plant protein 35-like [Zingiber officinale]KAG6491330.1 hypothetical protein ZIOFF_052668 [Zingiber officinale]